MFPLIAVFGFLMFAPQDGQILHRAPVEYPRAALEKGIQGSVVVEVDLDAEGLVSDARVVSGPAELRNAALTSVLDWHFSKQVSPGTTQVTVEFKLPATAAPRETTAGLRVALLNQVVRRVSITGLPDDARNELLRQLPIHEGDTATAESIEALARVVREFDEHLQVSGTRIPEGVAVVIYRQQPAPGRIRVGGNVQQVLLRESVRPVYPPEAKAAGVQGTVRLNAVIGKDGRMQELSVISGDPALAAAAMDAVRQWVYEPTLLNGQPVEVATQIDVNFTLAR